MTTLVYILIALAVGFAVGRWRYHRYQNRGEALVSQALKQQFVGPDAHLMNHITLPLKDGSTQIDHVLLTRFGIFVIETKHYRGWIFAGAKQATWTQVLYRKKFKFQNPLFQNIRHLRAVQGVLAFIPDEAVRPIVVFTGDAEFKTPVPDGVFSLRQMVQHLQAHVGGSAHGQQPRAARGARPVLTVAGGTEAPGAATGAAAIAVRPHLSSEQLQRCVGALEMARLAVTQQTDVEHIQGLQRRFGQQA